MQASWSADVRSLLRERRSFVAKRAVRAADRRQPGTSLSAGFGAEAQLLHDELQVLPGLAFGLDLLRTRTEQVRRMVRRHHQRLSSVKLPLPAQLRDPELGVDERCDRRVAESDDDPRL